MVITGISPMSAAVMTACTPLSRAPPPRRQSSGCGRAAPSFGRSRRAARPRSAHRRRYWPRPRGKRRSSSRSTGLPMGRFEVRAWSICVGSGKLTSQRDRPRDSSRVDGGDKCAWRDQLSVSGNAPLSGVGVFRAAGTAIAFGCHSRSPPKKARVRTEDIRRSLRDARHPSAVSPAASRGHEYG